MQPMPSAWLPIIKIGYWLACGGLRSRLWLRLRRNKRDALDDIETGAAKEAVHSGLGEAGCVVLDANGAVSFIEREFANSIDLANAAERHHGGLRRRNAVAVHYVQLRHRTILPRLRA